MYVCCCGVELRLSVGGPLASSKAVQQLLSSSLVLSFLLWTATSLTDFAWCESSAISVADAAKLYYCCRYFCIERALTVVVDPLVASSTFLLRHKRRERSNRWLRRGSRLLCMQWLDGKPCVVVLAVLLSDIVGWWWKKKKTKKLLLLFFHHLLSMISRWLEQHLENEIAKVQGLPKSLFDPC